MELGRTARICLKVLGQHTLKPRDRLGHRLLTAGCILLENVISEILRPLINGAVSGRAASLYFGLYGTGS